MKYNDVLFVKMLIAFFVIAGIALIVGMIVCLRKYIKNKKIIRELEKEHIKYVGTVKKVSKHPTWNEYNENRIYTVDVNGRDIECVQHSVMWAKWRRNDDLWWLGKHRRRFSQIRR